MDELTAHELRGVACAANLRRAFGVAPADDLPPRFQALLRRMKGLEPGAARGQPDGAPPASGLRSGA